jgi:hypothetical protein
LGDPISLSPGVLPPLAFTPAEGGFVTAGDVANTDNLTQEISYTATRSAPTPNTCTNKGFWTNPSGTSLGPAAQNPTGRPDGPPAFTGESEVDVGTNVVRVNNEVMRVTGMLSGRPVHGKVDSIAHLTAVRSSTTRRPTWPAGPDLRRRGDPQDRR